MFPPSRARPTALTKERPKPMMTGTRRKVRADAKLEQLTAEQHAQLVSWLHEENCSYTEAVTRVRTAFGVSVGRTAMVAYYQRHVAPLSYDAEAEAAALLLALPPGQFDAAAIRQAQLLAWKALANPAPEIDRAAKLLNLVRRAERQAIAAGRLKLAQLRVALREKELTLKSRRRAPVSLEAPLPERCDLQPSFLAPTELPTAPLETPRLDAPPTTPETPQVDATTQKTPPNPPLYSPYFALNQLLESVSISELTPQPPPHSEPAQSPALTAA